MMAFTGDGQVSPQLLQDLDAYTHKSTAEVKAKRLDITPDPPGPHPAADHCWRMGKAWQVKMEQVEFKKE